jgi:hypothetical protein
MMYEDSLVRVQWNDNLKISIYMSNIKGIANTGHEIINSMSRMTKCHVELRKKKSICNLVNRFVDVVYFV